MWNSIIPSDAGAPLLALVSLLAIAWVRQNHRTLLRRAVHLRRRLEADMGHLLTKALTIRQMALRVVELCFRPSPSVQAKMVEGCDDRLVQVERLRRELAQATLDIDQVTKRELDRRLCVLQSIRVEARSLADELDEAEQTWGEALDAIKPPSHGVAGQTLAATA